MSDVATKSTVEILCEAVEMAAEQAAVAADPMDAKLRSQVASDLASACSSLLMSGAIK